MTERTAAAKKAPAKKAADPAKDKSAPAAVKHADADGSVSPKEQAKLATLTKEQPPGAVSEVVTGTRERPESTRIVPPGEVPVSAGETRPAEFRDESQVAPAQVEGESTLHGNADY